MAIDTTRMLKEFKLLLLFLLLLLLLLLLSLLTAFIVLYEQNFQHVL